MIKIKAIDIKDKQDYSTSSISDFYIGSKYYLSGELITSKSIHVVDDSGIIDPNEILSKHKLISIRFQYPLSKTVYINFTNTKFDHFTRHDFWKCIQKGYTKIYREEEKSCGKVKTCAEVAKEAGISDCYLQNRQKTNGPYGIWGHIIEDLFIEKIREITPGNYELSIGS